MIGEYLLHAFYVYFDPACSMRDPALWTCFRSCRFDSLNDSPHVITWGLQRAPHVSCGGKATSTQLLHQHGKTPLMVKVEHVAAHGDEAIVTSGAVGALSIHGQGQRDKT